MTTDDTAALRASLVGTMPREAVDAIERGEPTWTTDELRRDFIVTGFAAPLVVVRRKSDGALGSLKFTHSPRLYFGWEEHK